VALRSRLERVIFPDNNRQALCILTLAVPLTALQQRGRGTITDYWDSSKTCVHNGIPLGIKAQSALNSDAISVYLANQSSAPVVATFDAVVLKWKPESATLQVLKQYSLGWRDMVLAKGMAVGCIWR
jgi:hypothetical protein